MNIGTGFWKYISITASIALAFSLSACGSDSSSDTDDEYPPLDKETDDTEQDFGGDDVYKDDDSDIDTKKDSNETVVKVNFNDNFDISVDTGSVVDGSTGITYKTVQIGTYIWITVNANKEASYSKCYNGKSRNCDIYGKLYNNSYTNVCPTGFSAATPNAWENLFQNAGSATHLKSESLWESSDAVKKAENTFGMSLLPGGFCKGNTCEGIYDEAYYLGVGDSAKIYILRYDSDKITSIPLSDFQDTNALFSIRCVKPATSVKSLQELTKCNDNDIIKVLNNDTTYKCFDEAWYPVLSAVPDSCAESEEGKHLYAKSTLMTCKSQKWEPPSAIEQEHGFCNSTKNGLIKEYDNAQYMCETNTWRMLPAEEVFGECKDTYGETIKPYNNTKYICKQQKWQEANLAEETKGPCTKDMEGDTAMIDYTYMVQAYRYGSTAHYVCKNREWMTAKTPEEYFLECTPEKEGKSGTIHHFDAYVMRIDDTTFICHNSQWKSCSDLECSFGFCEESREGEVMLSGRKYYYTCRNDSWVSSMPEDVKGPCTDSLNDSTFNGEHNTYVCFDKQWFVPSDTINGKLCSKENEGTTTIYYDTDLERYIYVYCHHYKWTSTDMISYNHKTFCNENSLGDTLPTYSEASDSAYYKCNFEDDQYKWSKISIKEQ